MADSPQWTDFNESDPGISLLELFAFLTTGYLVMNGLGPLLERTGLMKRVVIVNVDGQPWREVGTLEAAGPDDCVFCLDPASGSVEFGDGEHGRVPSRSVETTTSCQYGAGALGIICGILVVCSLWSHSIWGRWRKRRRD
jgi:hypothetical protein